MKCYWFESFELRLETAELLCNGEKVRLQPQPLQVLIHLVAESGTLVTRQYLIERLWDGASLADSEAGLNIAVKKLREALGDSAGEHRLIETLPRRGYRFIGAVSTEPPSTEPPSAPEQAAPQKPRRRAPLMVAGLAGLIVAGFIGWKLIPGKDPVAFRPRDAVVVAQFSNQTGESNLDGVIEAALESELSASPYVTVASRERVADALKLMRQPVVPRVPPALAREVCQRDPGLRAGISGFIRKVGSGYLISAEVLRPESGQSASTFAETASSPNGILGATRKLSIALREYLGEKLPARPAEQIQKVTTKSIEALRFYSEANESGRYKWASAEVLLSKAVQLDPEFASAHILLAWAVFNQRPQSKPEALEHASRALTLAGHVPEREELFIRGSEAFIRGDLTTAKSYHEALFRMHPDHYWAGNNLLNLYLYTGERINIRAVMEMMLEQRPNDPRGYSALARECLCAPKDETERALELSAKSVELSGKQSDPALRQRYEASHIHLQAMVAWLTGNIPRANALLEEAGRLGLTPRDSEYAQLAFGLMALGRLRDSGALIEQLPPLGRARWSIWRFLFAGDSASALKFAPELEKHPPHPMNTIQLARLGRLDAASRSLTEQPELSINTAPEALSAARAEVFFAQGRLEDAIRTGSKPALGGTAIRIPEYLLAAQTVARAYQAQGGIEKAITVLRDATSWPRACMWWPPAAFWPATRLELLKLYRVVGRHKEADAVHRELSGLMAVADADHPIKVALRLDAAKVDATN
jgi:DNA-binding winged helix-turn-helix (wHTH) protein/tetratricopeptide (TPR) repeat protein